MAAAFLFSLHITTAYADGLYIEGGQFKPISISPEKSTGLNALYVVYDTKNCALKYKTDSPQATRVSYYSSEGATYNIPVESVSYDGEYLRIDNPLGDVGYIFETNGRAEYYWLVDYSKHCFSAQGLNILYPSKCDDTSLSFIGNASPINFYSINGRLETLSRDIELSYNTLRFDADSNQFIEEKIKKNIAFIDTNVSISPAVTCQTTFTIIGDKFLRLWGLSETVESDLFSPVATMVVTEAVQDISDNETIDSSNEIISDAEGLGGSAPATISFLSYISDAVVHCEWQMATDESFEDIIYRFNQQDLTYTFTSEGTTYVRFIGSNSDGSCESYGDTYIVNIGASTLLIPNAFSPNGDGINDEWKVSYKSLIDFKCWIFDRQGHELFFFSDPNKGWDGKSNGRSVAPGVYYYVITATGSDGKRYKRSGDINIIRSKGTSITSGSGR